VIVLAPKPVDLIGNSYHVQPVVIVEGQREPQYREMPGTQRPRVRFDWSRDRTRAAKPVARLTAMMF
jgi:hypothetical protein